MAANNGRIYLDHAATTPVDPRVVEAMLPYMTERFGNPSSIYGVGREAAAALGQAREQVAAVLNCRPEEVHFTSGGTEADNAAVRGIALAQRQRRGHKHLVTAAIEHHAVLHTVEWMEKHLGFEATYLPVDENALVRPSDLGAALRDDTALVSIMYANNEVGTIEPIAYHIVREYNPEWISIDIRGRNAHIFRGAMHRCIVDEDAIEGACCDPFNGSCTLTTEAGCRSPLEWLGAGTRCDACNPWTGGVDFGDAPDSYRTLAAGNGARHTRVTGVHLGTTVDVETEAIPDPEAMGDDADGIDDEDGVVFSLPMISGERTPIEVTASTAGYLNAWLDANQDGDFGDPGEQIFSDELLAPGVNNLSFRVPSTALAGTTFARFRFNTRGLLDWYGPATDGEVEDYQVSVVQPLEPQPGSGKGGLKWSQPPQRSDPATPFLFSAWGEPSNLHVHQIAADDWPCEDERPVTGFQWWGSFEGWTQSVLPTVVPLAFHVAVWTDNSPEGDRQTGLGCPDTLLWETYCTNWTWNIAGYHCDPRESGDETCFQFTCLLSQNQWFHPAPGQDKNGVSLPAVYWLSIAALYDTPAAKGQGSASVQHAWGWTTRRQSFGSGAMRITTIDASGTNGTTWPPSPGSHWLCGERVEYPKAAAWDLAFELLTNQDSPTTDPDLAPVYRFWSESLATHFYTIRETEKDLLIREYPHVWTYDGIAFYAYPPDRAPAGARPVYRFWSDSLGRHLYTTREDEKQTLIEKYAAVWVFEGIAWYTLD